MVAKTSINHEHCKLYAASVSAVSSKEIKQLESKLFKFIWERRNDKELPLHSQRWKVELELHSQGQSLMLCIYSFGEEQEMLL